MPLLLERSYSPGDPSESAPWPTFPGTVREHIMVNPPTKQIAVRQRAFTG